MNKLFIFLSIILAFSSCNADDPILPEQESDGLEKKQVDGEEQQHQSFLIWLNGDGKEVQSLAEELQRVKQYDKILSFNDLPGDDKIATLISMARDTLNDMSVVGDIRDFITGKYTSGMIQEVRHNRKGVIIIGKEGNAEELKAELLQLLGVYVDKGFYKVSFPKEEVYDFYWANDPDALKKLCGIKSLAAESRVGGDPSDLEVTNRALHAMKKIRISNKAYIYTNDYKYKMTGYEQLHPYTAEMEYFKPRADRAYDALIDREWNIDVYNLRIYAPTDGDNLLAVYNVGGAGFINRIDEARVQVHNPPKDELNCLVWGLRNKAYSTVSIRDAKESLLNLRLIKFAPGLPETETDVTHSQSFSIGFDLGFSPELKGEYRWGKSITYQLAQMTRKVSRDIQDARMDYKWEWYPETLFQGKKAMKDNGMIDGLAMLSPDWYTIVYGPGPVTFDKIYCNYNTDLQFNQNMLNYLQECAITTKTAGASAGTIAVDITDGEVLQLGGNWIMTWGVAPALHQWPNDSGIFHDLTVDVNRKTTVFIDYNNW